jgi:hypothetical protein
LDGRPVRSVEVVTHDIWDPVPEGPLAPAFRLANRLHVRTRPATVRAALLLRAGDTLVARRVAENERALRALQFLSPESTRVRAVGDSAVDLRVHTRDHWTTNPELDLESAGGVTYGAFSFRERNLLGLGVGFELGYREDPAGIARSASLGTPHLLGSRWRTQFNASTGSAGKSNGFVLALPFAGEDGRTTLGFEWTRVSSEAQLFQRAAQLGRVPRRTEEIDLWWGVGRRSPDGTVRRWRALLAVLDRRLEPSLVEPGAPPAFAGGHDDLRLRRLDGEVRVWRPRFVQRSGVERFDRVEDFDLGPSVTVRAGYAPRAMGSTADEGWVRLRMDAGVEAGRHGFGWVRTSLRSRLRREARETLAEVDARWVQQPGRDASVVLGAWGVAAHRPARDFQVVVGGLDGLRAYPVHALAGHQVWRLNAETRWVAWRRVGDLVSVGGAAFVDAARAWGPGAGDAPWHHDAGFGLRLSLPHSSLDEVIRVDVAWPIAPTRDGRREPVLTFGSSQAF